MSPALMARNQRRDPYGRKRVAGAGVMSTAKKPATTKKQVRASRVQKRVDIRKAGRKAGRAAKKAYRARTRSTRASLHATRGVSLLGLPVGLGIGGITWTTAAIHSMRRQKRRVGRRARRAGRRAARRSY